ncbi:MAG TPA: hypothetical protein VIU12_05005 [Chryseolinea sp.]
MTTQTLYHAFLLFHITGIILFIGTTVADYLAVNQFWRHYEQDPLKGQAIWQAVSKFSVLMGVGMILIIITAVGMMAFTHGVFGEQVWLRVKVPIVLLTILNGVLIRRGQGAKLSKILQQTGVGISQQIQNIKRNLSIFHAVQLVMFFAILLLSVFKFN